MGSVNDARITQSSSVITKGALPARLLLTMALPPLGKPALDQWPVASRQRQLPSPKPEGCYHSIARSARGESLLSMRHTTDLYIVLEVTPALQQNCGILSKAFWCKG